MRRYSKGLFVIIDFGGNSHWNKKLYGLGVDGRMTI